jgi:ABC-type branched-subunit amino acid transport system substrate-binding protein
MKLRNFVTAVFFILIAIQPLLAQQVIDEVRYNNGKILLGQKRYDLAMAEFLPLTNINPANPYTAQASYFYALSAFKAEKHQQAEKMLQQLKTHYTQWVNMPETNYLLANVLFEQKEYKKALTVLTEIPKATLSNDAVAMKQFYLSNIKEKIILGELVNEFPDDKTVAQLYADKLISGWYSTDDKSTLEKIVARHNLDKDRYLKPAKRKDSYQVAALLPFQLNQGLVQSARKNQFVGDLYAGMQLAQDTLQKQGIKINLYAYDSSNDTVAVKKIMNSADLKQMDLIIGPVYRSTSKVAAKIASETNIPVLNPLSQDLDMAETIQNLFLFESSIATQARQAATYAFHTFSPKTAVILYENTKDDTTFAYHYRQQFIKLGGKVRNYRKLSSSQAQSTASSFRSLNLTDLGHMAVFSEKMTAAVNATSLLQGKATKLPLITYHKWLDINQITLKQLDNLEVYFISPKYIAKDTEAYRSFRNKYVARYNIPPSIYAYAGFEMFYFYGKLLQQYGTNISQGLAESGIKPGILYSGIGYTDLANRKELRPDNQYIPITKLEDLKLVVVNPVY